MKHRSERSILACSGAPKSVASHSIRLVCRELLRVWGHLEDERNHRTPAGGFAPLEREYMEVLSTHLAVEPVFDVVSSIMLFTYTDRDGYVPPTEMERSLLSGVHESAVEGSGISSAAASLTASVANPLANPKGVVAHGYKEHPYQVMYVMAAVGVNKEDYRARKMSTRMYEVPLLMIRAYDPKRGPEPDTSTLLLEMRPGFAEPLPLDETGKRSAATAGITVDTVLGKGKYGGDLKLREVKLPPSLSATSPDAADAPLAAIIEVHTFRTPDGSKYEFSIINPSEDASTAVLSANAASAMGNTTLALASTLAAPYSTLSALTATSHATDGGPADLLAAALQAERKAMEAAAHRVGSDFHSAIGATAQRTSRISYFIEVVAGIGFPLDTYVFVAYELAALPLGWRLLDPMSDGPEHATANAAYAISGVTQAAKVESKSWKMLAPSKSMQTAADTPFGATTGSRSDGSACMRRRVGNYHGSAASELLVSTSSVDGGYTDVYDTADELALGSLHSQMTILSEASGTNSQSVASFCNVFDIHLAISEEGGEILSSSPRLVFSVFSKDALDRHHVLGYGSAQLPLTPGINGIDVHTVQPRMPLEDMEKDFFLGGTGRALDPHAMCSGESRLGTAAAPSGRLSLRIHAVTVSEIKRASSALVEAAQQQRAKSVNEIIAHAQVLRHSPRLPVS